MLGDRLLGAMLRRRFVVLALLALLVPAFVPQGYMISGAAGATGLTICTGHGPLVLNAPGHQPANPAKSSNNAPCAFAGLGVGLAAAAPTILPTGGVAFVATILGLRSDLAPGRGLAAPPPPSQGPPILSV